MNKNKRFIMGLLRANKHATINKEQFILNTHGGDHSGALVEMITPIDY